MPRYGVQIHPCCLLDNHFHLLLFSVGSEAEAGCPGRDAGLPVLAVFTAADPTYRDGRNWPLFRRRFTSVAVEAMRSSFRASRNIHSNPVEAGLVAGPWQWPWSSAQASLGLTQTPAWLHTEAILEMLGPHERAPEVS